ncbi:MAG: TetR/AcrR family transcriptional regulator [Geminicoccaceae bacterium]
MQEASRNRRRSEIMDIAVEVLAERGYRDTSMLEIANRASASKETLYAWFGDKRGLFEAIIQRNARSVQTVLAHHLEEHAPTERILVDFGRALLKLLLGDSAIAINRAAISEARSDPTLAQTLASAGREATLPAFIQFLELHREHGFVAIDSPADAAEHFLGLLLGDAQIRRLLGVLPSPSKAQIESAAARATKAFLRLYEA